MNAGRVVVVVPFFNRRHTILSALESIRSQTVLPDQLIVVDDGSTDGGAELVEEWMLRSPQPCRLVQQKNRGVAAARNQGLSLAAPSEYVAFLDSDDVWPANFLARTTAALEARPDSVAASCDQRYVFLECESQTLDCSPLAEIPIVWMMQNGSGIASSTLFRRAGIERRGGFPNLITGEDAALFLPLSLDGRWLHVPGEPVDFHRGLAERLGDEMNLSAKYVDGNAAWIQIYENFLRGEGRAVLERDNCRKLLARAWMHAGKDLYRAAAPQQALRCVVKSWVWNPWRLKCYAWMLRAALAMLVRPPSSVTRSRPTANKSTLGHFVRGNRCPA